MAFAWLGVQGVLSGSTPEPLTESPAPDAPSIDATPTPLERLSSFIGGGDVSTLLTRFFQFGALGSFLQLLGISETIRWLFNSLYEYVIGRFILTVHFDGDELPYLWLMLWLSKQEKWTNSRSIQVSSQNFGLSQEMGLLVPGEDTAGKEGMRPLSVLPNNNDTQTIWYKRRLMRVTRHRNIVGDGRVATDIVITCYTRKHQTIYDLLLEAKRLYESETESRIVVYALDQYSNWIYMGSRPKRLMDSVIIPTETKELLLEDAKDFLDSEEWYGQRGIPWQRGWLFYGAPGSGKTSTIQAIAGELGLHIYVVSLSKRGMDDTSLNTLINGIPSRAIILMEDIDAAFSQSINREPEKSSDTQAPQMNTMFSGIPTSSLTLSGLLNAIDGVQAQQGRLLFATTNHYDALDPALIRPGRLDLHIEFKLANKWQTAELYKRFYPVEKAPPPPIAGESPQNDSEKPANGDHVPAEKPSISTVVEDDDFASGQRISTLGPTETQQRGRKAPKLTQQELEELAQQYADAIPDEELSMAAIQGHLMMHKTRPHAAVRTAARFVANERERRNKAREAAKAEEEKRKKVASKPAAPGKEKEETTSSATDASSPASTAVPADDTPIIIAPASETGTANHDPETTTTVDDDATNGTAEHLTDSIVVVE